jgi:hypothetical protein
MKNTSAKEWANSVKLHLGFDPVEAVNVGFQRGWVSKPEAEQPLIPATTAIVRGYRDAAAYLGASLPMVSNYVTRGLLKPCHRGGRGRGHLAAFTLEELHRFKSQHSIRRTGRRAPLQPA